MILLYHKIKKESKEEFKELKDKENENIDKIETKNLDKNNECDDGDYKEDDEYEEKIAKGKKAIMIIIILILSSSIVAVLLINGYEIVNFAVNKVSQSSNQSKDTLKKEFPFSIICAILLAALGAVGMTLGRIDGIVFLVIFAVYLCLMIVSAKNARNEALNKELEEEVDEEIKILPVWQCIVYIIGGAVAIKFGGDFVVDGASTIATGFGISQNLIGLTIVALGTSLPELVTSIVAAKKNEVDMALGNVIGSNIFNILLVLGVAGAISPVAFVTENLIDIAILVVMSVVVWIFAWSKKKLVNWHGAVMLVSYVAYLVYICIR